MAWLRKRPHEVLLRAGQYEIAGHMQLPDGAQLGIFLEAAASRFLIVTKATLTHDARPRQEEQHDVIFVNREHADFIVSSSLSLVAQARRQA